MRKRQLPPGFTKLAPPEELRKLIKECVIGARATVVPRELTPALPANLRLCVKRRYSPRLLLVERKVFQSAPAFFTIMEAPPHA